MRIKTTCRKMWQNMRHSRLPIAFIFKKSDIHKGFSDLYRIMNEHGEYKNTWYFSEGIYFFWCFSIKENYKFNGYREVRKTLKKLKKANFNVKVSGAFYTKNK